MNREHYSIFIPIKKVAMKTCQSIRKKLSAYQDGEVGTAERDFIKAHLLTCEACTKQHETLLRTYQMLRSLPEIEPAFGLSRQIVESVKRIQEPFWVRTLGEAFRLLPARAAIVTLAVSGLLVGTILGNLLTDRQFHSSSSSSSSSLAVSSPVQAITLAAIRVFDATPPGSFAKGYMQLASQNQERSYEK